MACRNSSKVALAFILALAGCAEVTDLANAGADAGPPDSGAPDAELPDTSVPDNGTLDGGSLDARVPDASLPDTEDASLPLAACNPIAETDRPGTHAAEFSVEQDGELLPSTHLIAGAYFTTLTEGDVLRITVISEDDPVVQIADDESSIILILDFDPSAALDASGETLAIDQTIHVDQEEDPQTLFDSAMVQVTQAVSSELVRRVLVARSCFCGGFGEVEYRVHGDIALEHVAGTRFRGAFALDFSGDLTSTPGQTELHLEGCFDVEGEDLDE